MRATELLTYLRGRGVELWADGDRLRYRSPKGVLTPALRGEMAEHKLEIKALLRETGGAASPASPPLQPISREGELPLSFVQERLWFLGQLKPDNPAYNIPVAVRITGPLKVIALEQSINEIVRRHEVWRTTCSTVSGKPVQVIAPDLTLTLPVVDLRKLPRAEREAEALRLATEEARRPFDLAQGPLLRLNLLRLSEGEYVLLLTMHDFVADGWSMGILFHELSALYEAFSTGKPSPLPELAIQYADFAHWQRQRLWGEVLEAQLSYWKNQLDGAPPALELPTDRPRPAVRSHRGATQSFTLPKTLSDTLRALSRREGVTLFMTLLAAFQTLLHRYTHQNDIIAGTIVSTRNQMEIEGLIGSFANNLLMRTDFSGNPTFRELLDRVRRVALGAYAHQDLPFENLLEELQLKLDLGRSPLFVLHRHSLVEQDLKLSGLTLSRFPIEMGTARYDLSLAMADGKEELSGSLQYSTDLFDAATIDQMLGHFQTLLEGTVTDPDKRISELPLAPNGQVDRRALPAPDQARPDLEKPFVAPRTPVEEMLAGIWAQVLGLERIGVYDNFFELGGHSMLVVLLFARIEKVFGKSPPPATLFQAPTVEQLASILRQEEWSALRSSLAAIQPIGSKRPFFCVPGMLGNVFIDLGDLARHLGPDQPFYGLQDGIQNPSQIEALASHYVGEIRAVQSEGPYLLGGVCSGGVVAFEMAQQLQAQGKQVALLALVEPVPPWVPGLRTYIDFVGRSILRFAKRFRHHSHRVAQQRSSAERRAYARLRAKVFANMWALTRYAPQPYAGHIELFLTSKSLRSPQDPQLGWRELAIGGADVHEIPGTHATITGADDTQIEEAYMQVLADQLSGCIENVLADDSN